VTYSSPIDAQDAIDNMDLNELRGRVLKVNQAKPMKGLQPPDGNRASTYYFYKLSRPPLSPSNSLGIRRMAATAREAIGTKWRSAISVMFVSFH
jgi:peptidyl-prolyl isomerase E (cyclophilin E)